MSRLRRFWDATIGKKIVMGATGLIMVGFLVGHMLGNLQIFLGAERLNAYSKFLHGLGELLWVVRGVLLVALVLHVIAAVQLTRIGLAARPMAYGKTTPQASTFASRTIRFGGLFLAFFIVFHLLHFTMGKVQPALFSETNVYRNVVGGFLVPWVAALYVVAMVVVGLHLYHGTWSAFRTLGIAPASPVPLAHRASTVVAVVVWLGFTLVPVGVFFGWVR